MKVPSSSFVFLLFLSLIVATVTTTGVLRFSSAEETPANPSYNTIDFKFVADIEVAWGENGKKTATARVFGDPATDGYPCVIVTANRTEIAMAQNYDLARVTVCGQRAVNMKFSQLDPEFQMLARVCGVMKYPTTWSQPLKQQQLAGVPVYSGEAACQPTPDSSCQCTCRWAFDPPQWVGEAQQALRAEEVTNCPNNCFPDAFITVMSMMKVKMTPEMIIGNCDIGNEGATGMSSSSSSSWNTNNNQNSDGTSITYNFGAPTNFPSLPQDFAANFKVTLIEYGVSIEFTQIFNTLLRAARTTVFNIMDTGSQEFASGDTYLTHGTSQLVYRINHATVHGDAATDYSWADNCEKMLYSDEIFASSVHRLLLVPSTAPPVFVGRYSVRGVPCDLWTQAVSATLKVDWYFPILSNSDGSTTARLPRRIVLRGAGRSPFFANHPFVPTSTNLKTSDTDYCERTPFFLDPHCSGDDVSSGANFQHVIEVSELPRSIAQNKTLFNPPPICLGSSATVVGSSANNQGVSPALVFFLSAICFGIGIASARAWCPGNNDNKNDGKNANGEEEDDYANQEGRRRQEQQQHDQVEEPQRAGETGGVYSPRQ